MKDTIEEEIWLRLLDKTVSGEVVWKYNEARCSFQAIIGNSTFRLKWEDCRIMLRVEDNQECLLGIFDAEVQWFWQNPPAKSLYRYLQKHLEWIAGTIKTIPKQDILNLINQSQ